jgi:YD repeat-containing protein
MYGSSTYAYDDAGNLTSTMDAKLQTVTYTYDDLNRPLTEDHTGAGGTEITYGYDTCTDGKGRLCGATTTDAGMHFTYFPDGSIKTEKKTIS